MTKILTKSNTRDRDSRSSWLNSSIPLQVILSFKAKEGQTTWDVIYLTSWTTTSESRVLAVTHRRTTSRHPHPPRPFQTHRISPSRHSSTVARSWIQARCPPKAWPPTSKSIIDKTSRCMISHSSPSSTTSPEISMSSTRSLTRRVYFQVLTPRTTLWRINLCRTLKAHLKIRSSQISDQAVTDPSFMEASATTARATMRHTITNNQTQAGT